METVTAFLKENFDLINLLVGVLGVFKKRSKNKK